MIKRLSDIIHEIYDKAKNKAKIVYFNCLKKDTLSPFKLDQSENESDYLLENDSDTAFEIVISSRRHVTRKFAAQDVSHQAKPEAAVNV